MRTTHAITKRSSSEPKPWGTVCVLSLRRNFQFFVRRVARCAGLLVVYGFPASIGSSHAKSSYTGTFGSRRFATRSEADAFNTEVIKWFSKRGFAVDASTTFYDLEKCNEWKVPGVLLCRRYDPANRIYVFIPECCRPRTHEQVVTCDVEFSGTAEEVGQRDRDFGSLQQEYRKRFPGGSTATSRNDLSAGRPESGLSFGIGSKGEVTVEAYNIEFGELLNFVFDQLAKVDTALPFPRQGARPFHFGRRRRS